MPLHCEISIYYRLRALFTIAIGLAHGYHEQQLIGYRKLSISVKPPQSRHVVEILTSRLDLYYSAHCSCAHRIENTTTCVDPYEANRNGCFPPRYLPNYDYEQNRSIGRSSLYIGSKSRGKTNSRTSICVAFA